MFFFSINILLICAILALLVLISMVWPPDSPWAPFWRTKPDTARIMCKLAKVDKNTLIYDLGCGTGTALIVAAKEFGVHGVGIEIDPLRFMYAWIQVHQLHLQSRITIIRDNFFNIDLSAADVFFIYLIPNALKRLTPKFLKEIKNGALFVSYVYPMPEELFNKRLKLIKHDRVHRIFVYKIRK